VGTREWLLRRCEDTFGREDATPDTADEGCRTPLSWAAGNGDEDVVKMLFEREDVTPSAADNDGRKPLPWAAGKGCEDIVKMLLRQRDANADTADNDGRTPLGWAEEWRLIRAADIFLERCCVLLLL